jgi:hypothetical protein
MALVAPVFGGKNQFLKNEDPGGNMAEKKEERPADEKPSNDRPGKKKFFDFKIDPLRKIESLSDPFFFKRSPLPKK